MGLILKQNFCFDVNGRFVTTLNGHPVPVVEFRVKEQASMKAEDSTKEANADQRRPSTSRR